MKILTIMSKLEMGGIEKTLLSCIPYLKNKGVEMSILCSFGGELDEDYKQLGVKLINFNGHKKPFRDAIFLRKLLKKQQFDIVHSRFGHTSGGFAKVCNELKIPFLVSIHNERAMFRNSWSGKPILKHLRLMYLNYHKRLTIKYATKIIGHSKTNLKYYTDQLDNLKDNSLFEVLYNGVDFSKFENFPELVPNKKEELHFFLDNKEKVLVHIGSFKEQKNHKFLINVFEKLAPLQNNYGLILLGCGGLMNEVKEQVEKLSLQNNVLFVGMESNIAPYLFASDMFFFPSIYEGFGNVLIEAQYANILIAASDIRPHYEACYSDYHQYFYKPTNLEQALNNITKLLSVDNTMTKKSAKEFAEKFSVEAMATNMFNIFIQSKNGK